MSATRAGLWRVVVFTMLASVRADAGKQIEQKHDPAWNTTYLAGSWPVGVWTNIYVTRTTSAAVADESKYAYPTGKHAQSCMVKKTRFHAKCCNALATFPSWSQCKKKDKFDGHQVRTQFGPGIFNGDFSCNLEKVTTCAMDVDYGKDNSFYSQFVHLGNMPRLTCIRESKSSFSWTKANIEVTPAGGTQQTFTGSDPDEARKKCEAGYKEILKAVKAKDVKATASHRYTCSAVAIQSYAQAKLS